MKLIRYCALFLLSSAPLCHANDSNLLLKGAGNAAVAFTSAYLCWNSLVYGLILGKSDLKSYKEMATQGTNPKGYIAALSEDNAGYKTVGPQLAQPLAYASMAYLTGTLAYRRACLAYRYLKAGLKGETLDQANQEQA